MADYYNLQNVPVFRGLSIPDIEKALSHIEKKFRKYRSGSIIAHSGEPVTSMMIVMEGTVKGEMVDYSGRVIKIEDIPAPGTLAAAFLFGSRNLFPVNVAAVSDTEILVIEKHDFLKLLMNDDRILANFLDIISDRSQFLTEKIKFLSFKTIRGKLAQFILQHTVSSRRSFNLGMTQADLADYFGVARPSVARALKEMEEEGLIEASAKIISVLDRTRLMEITQE